VLQIIKIELCHLEVNAALLTSCWLLITGERAPLSCKTKTGAAGATMRCYMSNDIKFYRFYRAKQSVATGTAGYFPLETQQLCIVDR